MPKPFNGNQMNQSFEYSIVVLCFGSGARIPAFVETTIELLLEHKINDYQLVLVGNYLEDHSDETATIVRELAQHNSRILAIAKKKEGMMGWDMRGGMAAATGNYISVIDGDGQNPIEDLVRIYQHITEKEYDLVKTFRTDRGDGFYRRAISSIFNTMFRLLFPSVRSKDINSKPKVFSRATYDKLNLRSDDWFIDAEIMIQAGRLNLRIAELPTTFNPLEREGGSFVKVPTLFEFVRNLIKYRLTEFRANKG